MAAWLAELSLVTFVDQGILVKNTPQFKPFGIFFAYDKFECSDQQSSINIMQQKTQQIHWDRKNSNHTKCSPRPYIYSEEVMKVDCFLDVMFFPIVRKQTIYYPIIGINAVPKRKDQLI